jgi:enamine deaminase RidA (YjgF/YER057c/UK114 family)
MGRTVLGPVGTPYSVGLKVSGSETVYLAGHLAVDESGALVAPGDMEGQARYIFESMAKILAEAGGSLSDVVKITAYITTCSARTCPRVQRCKSSAWSSPAV